MATYIAICSQPGVDDAEIEVAFRGTDKKTLMRQAIQLCPMPRYVSRIRYGPTDIWTERRQWLVDDLGQLQL